MMSYNTVLIWPRPNSISN